MGEKAQQPLRIHRTEQGITVFNFDNLGRQASQMWESYTLSMKERIENSHRLRTLFDFRGCGPPSLYAIRAQKKIGQEVTLPPDTRVAYLLEGDLHVVWAQMLRRNRMFGKEEIQFFTEKVDAFDWLSKTLYQSMIQRDDGRGA